jgi:hypothetical protein
LRLGNLLEPIPFFDSEVHLKNAKAQSNKEDYKGNHDAK